MGETPLAKRLVEHPRFKWRVGMWALGKIWDFGPGFERRLDGPHPVTRVVDSIPFTYWGKQSIEGAVPDLADPATQGVLQAECVEGLPPAVNDVCAEPWSFETSRGPDGWLVSVRGDVTSDADYFLRVHEECFKHECLGHALAECLLWLWGRE